MKETYIQEFQASAISQEIISLNFRELEGDLVYEYLAIGCQKRLNGGRLPKAWLDLYRHCEKGGWWCSGVDLVRGDDNNWGCFKPDFPRLDEYGLKPIKYEHPKGVPTDVFALRIGEETAKKISERYGIKIDEPDNFWELVIENPSLPVIITEGAKKAACLLSHGYIAIALPGIWGGYRRELKDTYGLIPPLVKLAEPGGRTFVIAFDEDDKQETRNQVAAAIRKLQKVMEVWGCGAVRLKRGGSFKGVDDQIVAEGINSFDQAYQLAVAPPPQESAQNGGESAQSYDEEPEFTFCEEAIQELYNHGSHHVAIDGQLYRFNGRYYEQLDPGTEKIRIREWARTKSVYDPKTRKRVYKYMNPRSVNSIWEWALISFGVSSDRVNPPGLNLANGVLKISWSGRVPKWTLSPHSPHEVYLYCSEVSYDPNANPEHCNRLLECLDPAPRVALLRTIAASLDLPNIRRLFSRGIRAGILRGAGSNGKDSVREATSLIFGDSMVSVDLSDFKAYDDGRKFYLAPLKHALVNWSSENNKGTSLDGLDSLNVCVTGEKKGIKIEEKNKQPTFLTPQSIHLFNVNRIPRISSGLDSILSRFAIYDFNKTFKQDPDPIKGELKADPRFHDDPQFMISEVCPAFLNRLLEELVNFCRDGIDYDSLKHSLDDIQEESTHLWQFVRESGLRQEAGGKVYITDLWDALREWYLDNGTLEIVELDNGKTKNLWNDQANKWDANLTGQNQIYKRFKLLFPKIEKLRETKDSENKGRWFLSGISINSASPASLPCTVRDSASLPASLSFTNSLSASLGGSEGKSEAGEGNGEAESRSQTTGEAGEAKNGKVSDKNSRTLKTPDSYGLLYGSDESYNEMVNFENLRLNWTQAQLADFAEQVIGVREFSKMTNSQKLNYVYRLRKVDSASPN